MSKEKEEKKSYTISDKRRFDSSGELRESEHAKAQPKSAPSESSTFADAENAPITFSTFVMSLATQILAQLGELNIPGVEKNLPAAKQTIEIVEMLQQKTKGNLDQSEAHLIEEMLHSVRMSFVRVSKGGA